LAHLDPLHYSHKGYQIGEPMDVIELSEVDNNWALLVAALRDSVVRFGRFTFSARTVTPQFRRHSWK
jgi:hypothetical protein